MSKPVYLKSKSSSDTINCLFQRVVDVLYSRKWFRGKEKRRGKKKLYFNNQSNQCVFSPKSFKKSWSSYEIKFIL